MWRSPAWRAVRSCSASGSGGDLQPSPGPGCRTCIGIRTPTRNPMTVLRASALLAALITLPALSGAQTLLGRNDSVFTWRGALPSGALLTVRNHNGPIDVRPASGSQVELRAEKRGRYGNLT